jgi:hypothetical protein
MSGQQSTVDLHSEDQIRDPKPDAQDRIKYPRAKKTSKQDWNASLETYTVLF